VLNRYEEASACRIVTTLSPEGLVTVDFGCGGSQPTIPIDFPIPIALYVVAA
jgi:hypothetical protein